MQSFLFLYDQIVPPSSNVLLAAIRKYIYEKYIKMRSRLFPFSMEIPVCLSKGFPCYLASLGFCTVDQLFFALYLISALSEYIPWLSIWVWLISLKRVLSISTHLRANFKMSLFLYCQVVFHCVNEIYIFFYPSFS